MPESPRITRLILLVGLGLLVAWSIILFQSPEVVARISATHLVQSTNLLNVALTAATGAVVLLGAWFVYRSARENYFLTRLPLPEVHRRCRGQHWIQETGQNQDARDFLTETHRQFVVDGYLETGFDVILTPRQFAAFKPVPAAYARKVLLDKAKLCLEANENYALTLHALTTTPDGQLDFRSLYAVQLALIIRAGYRPRSEDLRELWRYVLQIQKRYDHDYPDEWTDERKLGILRIWRDILPRSLNVFIREEYRTNTPLRHLRPLIRNLLRR